MKQIKLSFVLAIFLCMLGVKANAHDIEVKNNGVTIYYNWINNNTELEVTCRGNNSNSYENEYTGNVVIPESVTYNGNSYSVTSIGYGAFSYCWNLTSVTIPKSVTSIGKYAFYGCSGLTSITIPNSVTSIGYEAFSDCTGLTSVTIGNSVTSIDISAFSYCTGLKSVTFHCKEIGIWFCGTLITDVIIGDEVTSIGSSAFRNCTGLTSVTIPNSVTSIGEYAFSDCTGLTSITIPNSVTSIGRYAFSGCSGLTSVTIGNSVTNIGEYAFRNCTSLASVSFHCKEIRSWFMGSTSITDVIIGDEVTSIGNGAFSSCSGLTSVTIPNSVTSIGGSAFSGCKRLTSVDIPNSVTSIGESAFYECTGLTSVTIPNSVTSIGKYAFYGCSGLTSVTIGNCVESIDEYAFRNCTSLASVSFHCKEIGSWFSGSTSISEVIIGDEVTSIGKYAFQNCAGLTSVTIPNSVVSIGDYAFENCTGITTLTANCQTIGGWLKTISSLKTLNIGDGVEAIATDAFNGKVGYKFLTCQSLEEINVSMNNRNFESLSGVLYNKVMDSLVCYPFAKPDETWSTPSTLRTMTPDFSKVMSPLKEIVFNGAMDYFFTPEINKERTERLKLSFIQGLTSSTEKPTGSCNIKNCDCYIPKGTCAVFLEKTYGATSHIYEMDGDAVCSEINFNAPDWFSTIYDYDGDGEMEYFGFSRPSSSLYKYGFYDKYGNIKKEITTFKSDYYLSATPINGNGDLLYTSGGKIMSGKDSLMKFDLLTDIDNDGRKDLFIRNYYNKKFSIYYQQPDGTFKETEQSVVLDDAAIESIISKSNSYGGEGVASVGSGMFVKAPRRKVLGSNKSVSFPGGGSTSYESGALAAIDMNDDGILDLLNYSNYTFYSYDDNRFFANDKSQSLYPCDLNDDSELDYISYDGNTISLRIRESGSTFTEKSLFTNEHVKQIFFKDFDHDGDIDILAYIYDKKGSTTYFVFFRNDGDLSFKKKERNFTLCYSLLDIKDIDADGFYEMLTYDETNNVTKLLKIDSDLSVSDYVFDLSDRSTSYSNSIAIGDFNNDGKVDYHYNIVGGTKTGYFNSTVNTAPEKMSAPTATFNTKTGRLRIVWDKGTDAETSACDLTYELRIGTQPASGDIMFGASLADGTRRLLNEGNMGRSLSTLFKASSLKPGKYYISVQAIDGGGRGGAWSDDFVYEHQLMNPIIVSNYIDRMTTADTLQLNVLTPIEGATYQWTLSEGWLTENNGSSVKCVFEHDGQHTINLSMSIDGRTLDASPMTIYLDPARIVYGSSFGFVDINQDGYPEYLGYSNDGQGNLEKVLLSYVTNIPTGTPCYLDYNMDGFPDVIVKNNVYLNAGEQDNDFEIETETFYLNNNGSYYSTELSSNIWFDANNDGFLDNQYSYNDGTNTVWTRYSDYRDRYPNYDVNRDGFMDIVYNNYNYYDEQLKWYVMFKDSTANVSYSVPQLMYNLDERIIDWLVADINNDGYLDIVYTPTMKEGRNKPSNKIVIVKGKATLPYTDTVVYDLPITITGIGDMQDFNNDGYLDVLISGYEFTSSDTKSYLFNFGPDFVGELVDILSITFPYNEFMIQKEGGYPDGHESNIKNLPPSAPSTVAAKQTKDGLLITWSDAQDDHTPAMQMRYNISVKRKGKKGAGSFVISPMNGLIDKATICGKIIYKKSNQMLVPTSVLTAGETYEIQVQAIDLWNQHSPMTPAVEFTMTGDGYINMPEQVAVNKETRVAFVGTNSSSYSIDPDNDGTIVRNEGNGRYIVKWSSDGVKEVKVTAGTKTVVSAITVVKPIDLSFNVPDQVFAGVELTITLNDEMIAQTKDVGLRCSNKNVKINYVAGSKTATVLFPVIGTYELEAYCTDAVRGNSFKQTVNVVAKMPTAVIDYVDVDSKTGYYAVNWNTAALPTEISKVEVYKEGSSLGTFNKIAEVDASDGRYIDNASNPAVTTSRYNIRLLADNGQVSKTSVSHKPLHAMITHASQGYNLIWDKYEGLSVESYNILRGSSPDNLQLIAQVAGSINSYTDISAPSGINYYAVSFVKGAAATRREAAQAGDDETINSNIISTDAAIDAIYAKSIELIVLDEDKTLNDSHTDLQLYYLLLPTYSTVTKVKWEIVEGADIATINSIGMLHATGGNGDVVVRVSTIDGSNLCAEITITSTVSGSNPNTDISIADDGVVVLKEIRYFTLDGKPVAIPKTGQICVEWSIYSNGQIVKRKLIGK